ncbi:uncharacterized protein C8Q71DRAFT_189008 [Rhodofomes roseus]|uniref:Transmembrane protein n=1 Tax=Rhodofomes roseus TaxID=34475 RepID=A0ABQ8K9T6_9APHY|nr:uncharacterized protein C8Q71DRAFT_189008 [Rhodofomes roseus]KAH9833547.1 hypothetical protein C8Q71DRAFT_189008 [Rhodofomes roseus]
MHIKPGFPQDAHTGDMRLLTRMSELSVPPPVVYNAPRTLSLYLVQSIYTLYRHVMLVHWPSILYTDYYAEAHRHLQDNDESSFKQDWVVFVTRCRSRWKVFIGCCTVYNAVTIGLLSAFPGTVDMGMICGIVCVFASMVGSAVGVLLRTHLKEYRDPANGKWWLSSTVTESRWTSVPLLFAVPDAWFIWASIAFIVFFVAFCWERLAQGSSGSVQTAAEMRFYIAAAAMLSALATSGVAHVLMVLWVCHRVDARVAKVSRRQQQMLP